MFHFAFLQFSIISSMGHRYSLAAFAFRAMMDKQTRMISIDLKSIKQICVHRSGFLGQYYVRPHKTGTYGMLKEREILQNQIL